MYNLALHWIRIHLAHVCTSVFTANTSHVQRPRVIVIVGDRQPGVVGDHVFMDCQDGFCVRLDPRYLLIEAITPPTIITIIIF